MTRYIIGPCSIESKEMLIDTIELLKKHDIEFFRGGIVKYRSRAEDYQGIGDINLLKLVLNEGIQPFVEVFNKTQIKTVKSINASIQVGSRNMYNTDLLKEINKVGGTVLFKRHYCASLEEFINHAGYLDNCEVIMCLRGIQSLHTKEQRFFPDLTDIQRLREMTNNKICYDVSHSACDAKYVSNITKAALVYNPDYIMLETHKSPSKALSDPDQQLNFSEFEQLMKEIKC